MLVLPHLLDCGVCRVEGHVSVLLYKQSTHRSMLDKDCDDASAYVLLKESLNRCADRGGDAQKQVPIPSQLGGAPLAQPYRAYLVHWKTECRSCMARQYDR